MVVEVGERFLFDIMEILLVDVGLIICCCGILFKTPDSSLGHRLTVGRRRTPPSLAAVFVHVRGGGPVAGEVGGPMVEGRADLEGAADPGRLFFLLDCLHF
ncbi:hypothetical protein Taro_035934 [Colocasia esculenta]|uniref:Uncharacterized protein n=1 Tax=Colocasia esculenta TaxID=4460 RepID=A0A843W1Q6_COLES|nr:hypothetical protein [Colocasia esculenta]